MDLYGSTVGEAILEDFGHVGMSVFIAFMLACKRAPVPGQIRVHSDADALAQMGISGVPLIGPDGQPFELDDLWRRLGDYKEVRRRRSGRCQDVIWRRYEANQKDSKSYQQAEQKTRSRAENTETKRSRSGDIATENTRPTATATTTATELLAPTKVDAVWDAVMDACNVDTASIPPSKRGAYGKVVKELKELDATPQEITRRAGIYRRRWGADKLTPTALLSHWPEVATEKINGHGANAVDQAGEWIARKKAEKLR